MSVGRYEACPCGSGKKFKFCCMKKGVAVAAEGAGESVEAVLMRARGLRQEGKLGEACGVLRRALGVARTAEGYNDVGAAFDELGETGEAAGCYERAVKLRPELAEARYNLAVARLKLGDYERGWRDYEWRWKVRGFPARQRVCVQPLWDGGPLVGRTILLHAEQGLGDTMQFIRYVDLVAMKGGRVVVECQQELAGLIGRMAGVGEVVTRRQGVARFDTHCPLMTLPGLLGTRVGTIPRQVPYLGAEAGAVREWGGKAGAAAGAVRVGLVWAGGAAYRKDGARSMGLGELGALWGVGGVEFYSLQKGPGAEEAAGSGLAMSDLTGGLRDFSDTAALVANLDLVIGVDTSVIHLAGALGKPVWTLLAYASDWRWMREREDSPWYPTMRLFRQRRMGDWGEVVGRVAGALGEFVKGVRCGGDWEMYGVN